MGAKLLLKPWMKGVHKGNVFIGIKFYSKQLQTSPCKSRALEVKKKHGKGKHYSLCGRCSKGKENGKGLCECRENKEGAR